MAETVSVSVDIAAPAETVFALLADLPRMPEWSPEVAAVTYQGGATTAATGVSFQGRSQAGSKSWGTVSTITLYEAGTAIGWEVKSAIFPISFWRYTVTATATGCTVTETWTDRRNPLIAKVGGLVTGVSERTEHNRAGMETTLERLRVAVESA